MEQIFNKAQGFIYKNARPLDLARWQYHFEGGSKDAVLKSLSYYQNEDGGFGNALEPDSWNPNSSPIQTWVATEILREIDITDNLNSIIKGILGYLESGQNFGGKLWYNSIKSNNDFPHAPWWHTESDTCHNIFNFTANDYNPTACLAGFIIRFSDKKSELYNLGCRIAQEAVEQLMSDESQNDMYTLLCYIRLMEYIVEASATEIIDLVSLINRLQTQVKNCITTDTKEWEISYICKPSQFFNTNGSIFYPDNEEIAEYECEYIIKAQLEDGSWDIPWRWNEYPDEWAISRNWWKSNGIIINMLYLRGFGKI
ncbi:MAG TPA: hypothetical protein GXZ55_04935 [Natronincola sp.]|nr:hypothetical protein [Natronincola sp.]